MHTRCIFQFILGPPTPHTTLFTCLSCLCAWVVPFFVPPTLLSTPAHRPPTLFLAPPTTLLTTAYSTLTPPTLLSPWLFHFCPTHHTFSRTSHSLSCPLHSGTPNPLLALSSKFFDPPIALLTASTLLSLIALTTRFSLFYPTAHHAHPTHSPIYNNSWPTYPTLDRVYSTLVPPTALPTPSTRLPVLSTQFLACSTSLTYSTFTPPTTLVVPPILPSPCLLHSLSHPPHV